MVYPFISKSVFGKVKVWDIDNPVLLRVLGVTSGILDASDKYLSLVMPGYSRSPLAVEMAFYIVIKERLSSINGADKFLSGVSESIEECLKNGLDFGVSDLLNTKFEFFDFAVKGGKEFFSLMEATKAGRRGYYPQIISEFLEVPEKKVAEEVVSPNREARKSTKIITSRLYGTVVSNPIREYRSGVGPALSFKLEGIEWIMIGSEEKRCGDIESHHVVCLNDMVELHAGKISRGVIVYAAGNKVSREWVDDETGCNIYVDELIVSELKIAEVS